ncbi:MAG TPA: mycofactocin-associated electron transfer flavoprotein beta subunit [Acidimicrobiales bacterium]|nr:mycofactocin-associated electron transfer flavoprotein beta subunit [Acidimicrobiales bacterium]
MSRIGVCLKWVDRRPEVDPLTGQVTTDPRSSGASDADRAALEWALRLGEAWGWEVVAVSAGGDRGCRAVLEEALAAGADSARMVELDPQLPSRAVAAGLAGALEDAGLVLCGDWSLDRGSGSVPAFIAAERAAAQALGLVGLEPAGPGTVLVERRLDRGRRERLRVSAPAVLSVEGGTARLRRAGLPRVLAAERAEVVSYRTPSVAPERPPRRVGPYRPRARVLAGPPAEWPALARIAALTGASSERSAPQSLVLDPDAAAARILEALSEWGWRS